MSQLATVLSARLRPSAMLLGVGGTHTKGAEEVVRAQSMCSVVRQRMLVGRSISTVAEGNRQKDGAAQSSVCRWVGFSTFILTGRRTGQHSQVCVGGWASAHSS